MSPVVGVSLVPLDSPIPPQKAAETLSGLEKPSAFCPDAAGFRQNPSSFSQNAAPFGQTAAPNRQTGYSFPENLHRFGKSLHLFRQTVQRFAGKVQGPAKTLPRFAREVTILPKPGSISGVGSSFSGKTFPDFTPTTQ